ncbi:CHASE2 domain-containing protein [Tychonema sp. BBK16]|uniref:CHASE2 domain-containing protein n=1 Tax=Tychonema sp. BBK16 TaxID=2699888 RepID=UPI001F29C715|nr:CHASE2 domain-containing protein [Tychonema sp. BBK16]MCF6372196.1 CHASE2 domain-containing protein [Tychonema sp. BBK16]
MSKVIILEIRDADNEHRYAVTLRICDSLNYRNFQSTISGKFPPVKDLKESYDNLRRNRMDRGLGSYRKLEKLKKAQITNISVQELVNSVETSVNNWLNFPDTYFQEIRDLLLQVLSAHKNDVRVIIQTDNISLWSFPWHLWNIFQEFKIEPTFGLLTTNIDPELKQIKSKNKIRILVILGDSSDIDIEADLKLLQESIAQNDAEIISLVATNSSKLNDELWKQNWDILFFAGHSSSEDDYSQGKLALSETETIAIKDLKYGLENAIKHGLKLAIFNSCDGMGLVKELASLQIPAVIAMRERVPDEVAQKFLEYFLEAFAGEKKSLRESVRKARERLHGMNVEYPCASWLPMIYEHLGVEPPTWDDLLKGNEEERQRVSIWRNLQTVLVASVLVTGAVMGVRWLGILQTLELQSYDKMLQIRPRELKENRILLIDVTEPDLDLPEQRDRKGSLSELALNLTLEQLQKHQPKVIGLGIYYDFPINPKLPSLMAKIKNQKNLIASCKSPDRSQENLGNKPPLNIPETEYKERIGFSDFSLDFDGILRRHIITLRPDAASICNAEYAFSSQLAFRYLALTNGISPKYNKGELQLGKANLKRLREHMGGYHKLDDRSYEILLNYRAYRSPSEVISRVTLAQVLKGQLKSDDVKDKIVLIGTTAESSGDYNSTPYSTYQESYQKLPDVIIQAQMVSQLISAALDGRPLIWWWDFWVDGLWIWGWGVVGGAIAWRYQSKQYLIIVTGTSIAILYGVCWIFFTQSGWVPLIPSGLALVGTSFAVLVYNRSQKTAN